MKQELYDQNMLKDLKAHAIQLTGKPTDYDALLDYIGDAQIVMLGEATHGTKEFYDIRAEISQRLINEKNFNAILIEGDWPDAYHVNRYIHQQEHKNAQEALAAFDKFPTWMWRNASMVALVEWLAVYNKQKQKQKVSFYGLDLYSLYRSIDAVINYFEKTDPTLVEQARHYYACFDKFKRDPQDYGYAVFMQKIQSCQDDVIEALKFVQDQTWEYLGKEGLTTADEAFYAQQNARVVKNAESYYRSLFIDEVSNWNLRDSHMHETLNALIEHHKLKGIENPKFIVWAHNSHIGNARATQMSIEGEHNIGQLVKEQFGNKSVLVGFTTHHGEVSAASAWHSPVERKLVRPALAQSYEALFHEVGIPNFLLLLKDLTLPDQLLERAIGVIYRPETERASHYFTAQLKYQFDAIIHCDTTDAVEPLEKTSQWISGETPEGYPTGL